MSKKAEHRLAVLALMILRQRQWIEGCEANGISYADGERGQRIREADESELDSLMSEYRDLRAQGFSARPHGPMPAL